MGKRKDIVNLLAISDYLILPSKYEGFPNVVMEAMVSETFVLATDVGGTKELVENLKTGILIKSPAKNFIKESLKLYLSLSEEEKKKIIKNAEDGIKNFSIEELIEKNINLLERENVDI